MAVNNRSVKGWQRNSIGWLPPPDLGGGCLYLPRIREGVFSQTEFPVRLIRGNPGSYTRIPIRYRGVGKRACSVSFREEFFSETHSAEGINHPHKVARACILGPDKHPCRGVYESLIRFIHTLYEYAKIWSNSAEA